MPAARTNVDGILSQNTQALVLCRAAHYDYAALVLDQALGQMRRMYLESDEENSCILEDEEEEDTEDEEESVVFTLDPYAMPLGLAIEIRLQQHEADAFALYHSLFDIRSPFAEDGDANNNNNLTHERHPTTDVALTEVVCHQLASVMQYNKAVCLHLYALSLTKSTGIRFRELLSHVAQTYQQALGGLAMVSATHPDHVSSWVFLELAILSNSAQLQSLGGTTSDSHDDSVQVWHAEMETSFIAHMDTLLRGLQIEGFDRQKWNQHFSFFSKNVRTTFMQNYPQPAPAA